MVEDRITDGKRIAQLLASELDGREDDELAQVAVTNADRDVQPTAGGAHAYDVTCEREHADEPLARVFVHPEYARLEFDRGGEATLEAAADAGPDVRVEDEPADTDADATVTVLVESGAAVKRATTVVGGVCRSTIETSERRDESAGE